jgi:hypothetical protein
MRLIYLLFTVLFLSSCVDSFTEQEILGTYTPVDYRNCFDTIQLKINGVYHRRVYDIKKHLVLDMNGKWHFKNKKNSVIEFSSYFHNLDRDLIKFPELVTDTIGSWSHMIERSNKRIEFCVGYYSADLSNQNCYQKQE